VAVVERIFDPLVGQAQALLRDDHPQHLLQTDRRTPGSFAFGVEGLDRGKQRWPGCERIEVAQESVAAGEVAFGGVFKVGE
jgi:uncharacterized protein (DUF2249 family)